MYGGNIAVYALITAAGKGSRMRMAQNKQYMDVLGKPVLARTIQAFEDCDAVDGIVVTVGKDEIQYCRTNIVEKYGFFKVKDIVPGGASRQQSIWNGLRRVDPSCGIVLIHDGARPFIDEAGILACTEAAAEYGAAIAAVPVKDTIKRSDSSGFVEETADRNSLWAVQTPQAFRYPLIMEAHMIACEEGFDGTDDAILAERLGHKVKLVQTSYYNIKITTREDLAIAQAIASLRP